jgi:enoyl-[acyl-carrier-protein] reductase (NADH)
VHHRIFQLTNLTDYFAIIKTAFIAGVGDDHGYAWGIAKACAEAGAKIVLGVWPVVYPSFLESLKNGAFDKNLTLSDGSKMVFHKVSLSNLHRIAEY